MYFNPPCYYPQYQFFCFCHRGEELIKIKIKKNPFPFPLQVQGLDIAFGLIFFWFLRIGNQRQRFSVWDMPNQYIPREYHIAFLHAIKIIIPISFSFFFFIILRFMILVLKRSIISHRFYFISSPHDREGDLGCSFWTSVVFVFGILSCNGLNPCYF